LRAQFNGRNDVNHSLLQSGGGGENMQPGLNHKREYAVGSRKPSRGGQFGNFGLRLAAT
jgi:hypothetical protein